MIKIIFDDATEQYCSRFIDVYDIIDHHYNNESNDKHTIKFEVVIGENTYKAQYRGHISFNSIVSWVVSETRRLGLPLSEVKSRRMTISMFAPSSGSVVWSRPITQHKQEQTYSVKRLDMLTPSSRERLFRTILLSRWDIFLETPLGSYYVIAYKNPLSLAHYIFGHILDETSPDPIIAGYYWQLDAIHILAALLHNMDDDQIALVSNNAMWVRSLMDVVIKSTTTGYAGVSQKAAISCLTLLNVDSVKKILSNTEIYLLKQIKTISNIKKILGEVGINNDK